MKVHMDNDKEDEKKDMKKANGYDEPMKAGIIKKKKKELDIKVDVDALSWRL